MIDNTVQARADRFAALRKALEAELPSSPWISAGPSFGAALPRHLNEVLVCNDEAEDDGYAVLQAPTVLDEQSSEVIEYVSQCDPGTIRALLAEVDALRAAALTAPAAVPVAWQVRRKNSTPRTVWEPCTAECYADTLATGKYLGLSNGAPCEVRALVVAPSAAAPVVEPGAQAGREATPPEFDLSTSAGGRGYIAWYFTNVMKRHDFNRYIHDTLAADFACVLARWLRDGMATARATQGDRT